MRAMTYQTWIITMRAMKTFLRGMTRMGSHRPQSSGGHKICSSMHYLHTLQVDVWYNFVLNSLIVLKLENWKLCSCLTWLNAWLLHLKCSSYNIYTLKVSAQWKSVISPVPRKSQKNEFVVATLDWYGRLSYSKVSCLIVCELSTSKCMANINIFDQLLHIYSFE